ncbi:LysR substrate-binding domain-containing protein [Noviherbaspirillum sp. Root189]|uniref:LysR substrate-binding domain-containing protein n=1 Tax=Noviherbaspirillum sp. Root189 TaxID=1736487 RepID=UPI00070E87E2|nr:LysR family transcriptional regulator [Noviherbaspirillum sp. Root189]KRB64162.1 LysR family transcriptional regulator [Noviherbaspirillum sp. Root189]
MDQLFNMQVFSQIVDSGSLAQAARVLGLAPATVTGVLARTEKKLGVRLLDRTTRRISVTEAGRLWYEHANRITEQAMEAEDAVRSLAAEPRGTLRVTLPLGVAMTFVYPHLQEFSTQYPKIHLDLQVSDRIVDLVGNRFDLAFRAGQAKDSDLMIRRLLYYRRITCASPRYLALYGAPQHPSDLLQHQCLLYRHEPHPLQWEYRFNGDAIKVAVKGTYASNESHVLLAWARSVMVPSGSEKINASGMD